MAERGRDAVMVELGRVSRDKRAAVEAQDFAEAADLREEERALQEELHRLGGPRPGHYRIRIDHPDGSSATHEGPDYYALLDAMGVLDVTVELEVLGRAVKGMLRAFETGNTVAALERRKRESGISVTLSELRSPKTEGQP